MPVIYLSHGAPPLADDPEWSEQLAGWSADLPKPSVDPGRLRPLGGGAAHGGRHDAGAAGLRLLGLPRSATTRSPTRLPVRRSWPPTYAAAAHRAGHAGARGPEPRSRPRRLRATGGDVSGRRRARPCRSPCRPSTRSSCSTIGRKLAPLRDEGVLILGSGFTTHNLRLINMRESSDAPAQGWSREFDDMGGGDDRSQGLRRGDRLQRQAPAAAVAHPRTEHFAPLFVSLGASVDSMQGQQLGHRRVLVRTVQTLLAVQLTTGIHPSFGIAGRRASRCLPASQRCVSSSGPLIISAPCQNCRQAAPSARSPAGANP